MMNTVDHTEFASTAVKQATAQNSSRENGFRTPLTFHTVLNIQENRQKHALSKKSKTKEVQGPDNWIQTKKKLNTARNTQMSILKIFNGFTDRQEQTQTYFNQVFLSVHAQEMTSLHQV